jgi:hypothetical protein
MRNYIKILLIAFTILSCNKSNNTSHLIDSIKSENDIKKIEITEFDSTPKDYTLFKYNCISMGRNNADYIEYTYQNGELKNKEIIKSQKGLDNNSKVFDNIPNEYLSKNETFGNPNAADDGGLSMLVFLKNNKTITWTLSYNDKSFPKEIKLLFLEYKKIKSRLNL